MMREFETGATRDNETDKLDYEGFLSPVVLRRFAEYMHKHRVQADGTLRDSDNWQKGMPLDVYMKSMFRHFMDVWRIHRDNALPGRTDPDIELEEALCALLFNVMGYLYETLKCRDGMSIEDAIDVLRQYDGDLESVAQVHDVQRGQVPEHSRYKFATPPQESPNIGRVQAWLDSHDWPTRSAVSEPK